MRATVRRHTTNSSANSSPIVIHENSNLTIIESRVSLNGPKFGFIADARLEKTTVAFDSNGSLVLDLDVLRRIGLSDKYVTERWIVSQIRESV